MECFTTNRARREEMMVASLVNTDTLLLEDVQTYNLRIPTVSDGINSNIDKARDSLRREEIKITRDLMVPVVE